jgi:hypothetical protein
MRHPALLGNKVEQVQGNITKELAWRYHVPYTIHLSFYDVYSTVGPCDVCMAGFLVVVLS